jgi:hypothetical protein
MLTRRLLHHECNRRLRLGDFEDATRGFIALVRSAPHDFDARLRLADALLSAGQPELALPVYVFVLRETANAGHPLKAMVVLEILEALGHPEVPMLIEAMAARYAAGAPSLGRGVRLAPPDPEGEVPQAAFVPADLTPSQVLLAGAQVGASRDGLPALPEKLTPIALLSELPHDAFVSLLGAVQLKRVPMGDVIVREGDAGDAFFMVARERARCSARWRCSQTRRAPRPSARVKTRT